MNHHLEQHAKEVRYLLERYSADTSVSVSLGVLSTAGFNILFF